MYTVHSSKFNFSNQIDYSVFEFASALGALITFVLTECSSLYTNDRGPDKVEELINNIFKGIIWKDIFNQFRILFRDHNHRKQACDAEKQSDELSESLKRIYPKLSETLASNRIKFFEGWVRDNFKDDSIYKNCRHEWKERNIFKTGSFLECIHCRYQKLK